MSNPKIISARITAMPRSFTDQMPQVWAQFEGSEVEKLLFSYYPDEISFKVKDFIGKTEAGARNLLYRRDYEYLRS